MIPFLAGGVSLVFALLLSLPLIAIAGLGSYYYFESKDQGNPFVRSALVAALFAPVAVCGLTSLFIDIAFAGPPSPWFRPRAEEIQGTWAMPDLMVEYLRSRELPAPEHELKLGDDGVFTMTEFPYLYGPLEQDSIAYSGTGTWSIERGRQRGWVVALEFVEIKPTSQFLHADLLIEGRRPPYSLFIWKGELDRLVLEQE